MKTKSLAFFLFCFLNIALLSAQSIDQTTDYSLQTGESDEAQLQDPADQSASPLMMFGRQEQKTSEEKQSDSRTAINRGDARSGVGVGVGIGASQITRGTPGQGMAEGSETDTVSVSGQCSLTLGDFRIALASNPYATRFVIAEDGSIQARTSGAYGVNQSENRDIVDTLRTIVPELAGDELLQYRNSFGVRFDPLSASRLCQILERVDRATASAAPRRSSSSSVAVRTAPVAEVIYKTPSPLDQLSESEQQEFPGARVIEAEEVGGPIVGQKTQTKILRTNFKYPYIRIEQVIDATTSAVLKKIEMVADHLLVKLSAEETPESFLQKLVQKLENPRVSLSLHSIPWCESTYRLHFETTSSESEPLLSSRGTQTRTLISPIQWISLLPEILNKITTLNLALISEPDFLAHLNSIENPTDPKYPLQWNLKDKHGISAPAGWKIRTSAEDVIVAVLDTGIRYTHEDLIKNMWINPRPTARDTHGWNAYANHGNPLDKSGHGTHCAGIIGAIGDNGIGIAGVAWKIKLMACSILGESYSGMRNDSEDLYISDILTCIKYAVENGAKILNCSFRSPHTELIFNAIKEAATKGVIIVAASGNYKRNNDKDDKNDKYHPVCPASYQLDNIVSVAATTKTGKLATSSDWGYDRKGNPLGSNYGVKTVHLGAPGDSIWSTVALDNNKVESNSYYHVMNGTSMAAPHVAAALALMMAEFKKFELTYQQLIAKLLLSTDKDKALKKKTISGGRLNLAEALRPPDRSVPQSLSIGMVKQDEENIFSDDGSDLDDIKETDTNIKFLSLSLLEAHQSIDSRTAAQEIARWDEYVAEPTRRARAATREANERYTEKKAADRAQIAWNEVVQKATAARDYWSGIFRATEAGNSPFLISLEEATYEKSKWEEKMALAGIKAAAVQECAADWNSLRTRWNLLMTKINTELWPQTYESINRFTTINQSEKESVENKIKILNRIQKSLQNYVSASASVCDVASHSIYAAAYHDCTAGGTIRNGGGNHAAAASAHTATFASAFAHASTFAATASIYAASSAEEMEQALNLIRVGQEKILKVGEKGWIRANMQGNVTELKNQLATLERFTMEAACFKQDQEARDGLRHVPTKAKAQTILNIIELAAVPSTRNWEQDRVHLDRILTKIRAEIWPEVLREMKEFNTLTLLEKQSINPNNLRGLLYNLAVASTYASASASDYVFAYGAVHDARSAGTAYSSAYAGVSACASAYISAAAYASAVACASEVEEAKDIVRGAMKGINMLQNNGWTARNENINTQKSILREMAAFLDAMADFKKVMLTLASNFK